MVHTKSPYAARARSAMMSSVTRRRCLAAFGGILAANLTRSVHAEVIAPEEDGLPLDGTAWTSESDTGSFVAPAPEPVTVNGTTYDVYIDAEPKEGQWYQYTCEFDCAYIILKTFGMETDLKQLVRLVDIDLRVDPYAVETAEGMVIYGGDIGKAFSGNFTINTFSKTTGQAMLKAFEAFPVSIERPESRADVEAGLRRGELMWLKCTVDFAPYRPATWISPENRRYQTVYDNDHCVVAIGFNDEVVVVRDPLGPTETNPTRPFEYEVPWADFLDRWGSSGYDGLLIGPATDT